MTTRTQRSVDVAIIGGGAIGVCVAHEIARRGSSAVILERGADVAWGCSAGNAGIVGAGHVVPLADPGAVRDGLRWMTRPDSPFFVRPRPAVVPWLARFVAAAAPARVRRTRTILADLAARSATLHADLDAGGLDAGYRRDGLLDVFRDERAFLAARAAAADAEALTGPQLAAFAPQLAGGVAGGLLRRGEMHCDPLRFVRAMSERAREAGAEIRPGVEVLALRRNGSRVTSVWTTTGELRVGQVVVAAGVWSRGLAADLGVRLPLEGAKGYHVDVAARPGDPALPIWLHEDRVVVTPLAGRVRLGGTLELTGTDRRVDGRRVAAITAAAGRALPRLADRAPTHVWRGLRPCTPDGLPVIDRVPDLDNAFLATGHGMWGLQLAPLTGQLVADLAVDGSVDADLPPLQVDRFHHAATRPRRIA